MRSKSWINKLLWLGPTLLFSALLISRSLKSQSCYGLVEALGTLFLYLLLGISFLFLFFSQIIFIKDRKSLKAGILVVFTGFLIAALAVQISLQPRSYFESAPVLKSEFSEIGTGELILHENNTYTAKQEYTDWSCFFEGDYVLSNDTLYLEKTLILETDSLFSSTYLISTHYLIPIDLKNSNDTSTWLEIIPL